MLLYRMVESTASTNSTSTPTHLMKKKWLTHQTVVIIQVKFEKHKENREKRDSRNRKKLHLGQNALLLMKRLKSTSAREAKRTETARKQSTKI